MCIRDRLDVFKMFPDINITVHISGPLLLELIDRYPEYLDELVKLADHGSIEFLAGSIGEAILPILPPEDRFYQIREYVKVFEKHTGYRPRGFWLPERVWEPSLPVALARNRIEYVILDDSTLYRAGRSRDDALYAWVTEDSGYPLKLLFIEAQLRYILPWRTPREVVEYLLSRGDGSGSRYLLWGSDAEKFGEWGDPGWARNWLIEFFNTLRTYRHEVNTTHPSIYLEQHGVKGLIYLPSGSYDKMLEWSGGFFRNFLVKYRESNNLHKKMLWVRRKLKAHGITNSEAWRAYHLGQCNDAYWHGLFGGIYLTHLRQALYENFIRAERIAEEESDYYSEDGLKIIRTDFDYDGAQEIIIETLLLNAYLKPSDGGTLFELDYKEPGFEHNILNTMTRYPEPYLEGIGFNPDWYRRVSLREHLWSPATTIDDWLNNTPFIDQSDLALGRYSVLVDGDTVILRKIGHHYVWGLEPAEIFVEKKIRVVVGKPVVEVEYRFENQSRRSIEALIGLEYTLSPRQAIRRKDVGFTGYNVLGIDKPCMEKWIGETDNAIIKSPVFPDIVFKTSSKTTYWIGPITMPSRTEKGIKQAFQGIGLMPVYHVVLEPGSDWKQRITIEVTR